MNESTVSEDSGTDDDIHYLQCLKDEAVKVVSQLLDQSGLDSFVDATDLTAVRNRARYKKVSTNAYEVKEEIAYFIDKLDEIKQTANERETVESGRILNDRLDKAHNTNNNILSGSSTITDRESINRLFDDGDDFDDDADVYDHTGDIDDNRHKNNESIKATTEHSVLFSYDRVNFENADGREILREKNKRLQSTSYDQVDGKRADIPCNSLLNNSYTPRDKRKQSTLTSKSTLTSCNQVNESNNSFPKTFELNILINKVLRRSGQRLLPSREEIVKPFCCLKYELASPEPQLSMVRKMPTHQVQGAVKCIDTPNNIYEMDWENYKNDTKAVICRKYDIIDRNWIDVILFADYYLVTVQKKVPDQEAHEYLNKYNKDTGVLLQWMLLPDAGRMCKINEKGLVAVLQTGVQYNCINVVDTALRKFFGRTYQLQVLYRFSVQELYSDICCLGQSQDTEFQHELLPCFEFAAVFSVRRKGRMKEEIDRVYPDISKHRISRKTVTYTYESRKFNIVRRNVICSIDALDTSRIVVSQNYEITCIDVCGSTLWYMPTDSRVTDVCCYNNNIFACLPGKSQVLKIYTRNGKIFKQDENVIEGEHIKPSQVSASRNEILIREFIQTEYRSEVVIRITKT